MTDDASLQAAPRIVLRQAAGAAELADARVLMREYAATLAIDLGFQGFEAELASLPGAYASPRGHLTLAWVDDALAGCGAFRPLQAGDRADACEMKRLFVRPAFRRYGLGRILAESLMAQARHAGYAAMVLDTLDDMAAARGLYARLGFVEVPAYYPNPVPGVHYLRAALV